jgi:hypothetical protein
LTVLRVVSAACTVWLKCLCGHSASETHAGPAIRLRASLRFRVLTSSNRSVTSRMIAAMPIIAPDSSVALRQWRSQQAIVILLRSGLLATRHATYYAAAARVDGFSWPRDAPGDEGRTTSTGMALCVNTLTVSLPSRTAEIPRRPCEAMTMRSQPFWVAVSIMP